MTYFNVVLITDVTRESDFENIVESCDTESAFNKPLSTEVVH